MLVEHATRLAGSDLDGIEKAASEIAALAEGNGTAITAAYRLAMTEARSDHTTTAKQVVAIVRRAIEIGMSRWDFEETAPPP